MVVASPAAPPTAGTARLTSYDEGSRGHALEHAVVGLSTAVALVVLRLLNTQIHTEPGTIDPWFYTALMTNFDVIYDHFGTTYFASRLPGILPGYALNLLLVPSQAYVVLHIVFFLAGGLFLYLLVRTLFGVRIAVVLYPAILMNAIYVDAHTWDYVDGFVITYLSGGLYFLASCNGGRTHVRPALAGFFFSAAATTNLFATLLVLVCIAAYLVVRLTADRATALPRAAFEAAWFVTGAGALLAACGLFARWHGGRFLYFMPSIDFARVIDPANGKVPDRGWVRGEPRLLIAGFLAAVVALAWQRRRRPESERLGLALTVMGTWIMLLLSLWEFLGSSQFLYISYYFDQLFPFFFVMLAAAVLGVFGWAFRDPVPSLAALAGIGLVVSAAPLTVVFGIDRTVRSVWGGSAIAIALMMATLLLVLVLRLGLARRLTPAVALMTGMLAIGSVGYSSAASLMTYWKMADDQNSLSNADEVFSIGVQLMDFMERNGLETGALPAFWYDKSLDTSFTSLHSLYYLHEWYAPETSSALVSGDMSMPGPQLRARLAALGATRVVLLCSEPACGGGGVSLRHAGYDPVLIAAQWLEAGPKSVWVEAYRLGA